MGIPFQETIFETNLLNLIVVIYIVVTVVGEALTRELETRQKKIRERYENSLQCLSDRTPVEEPMSTLDSTHEDTTHEDTIFDRIQDVTILDLIKEKKQIDVSRTKYQIDLTNEVRETYALFLKEKRRIRQIENEHSKRIMQARYQQTALVRSKLLLHRKENLQCIITTVDLSG